MAPHVTFYDLHSDVGPWSPMTWRVRYALNLKKISYETKFLHYPELEGVAKSINAPPGDKGPGGAPLYTAPFISVPLPGAAAPSVVSDSTTIADFLDAHDTELGSTAKLFPAGTREAQESFLATLPGTFVPAALMTLAMGGIAPHFSVETGAQEYFHKTRRAAYGTNPAFVGERALTTPGGVPVPEWVPHGSVHREQAWKEVKEGWSKAAAAWKAHAKGKWFTGDEAPVWVDIVILGFMSFFWKSVESSEWEDVMTWDEGLWKGIWDAAAPLREKSD